MGVCPGPRFYLLVSLTLLILAVPTLVAWDPDLELLDLVEEIPQTFYHFLNLDQDASPAEVKKAYRRLSLILHPDKNKDENAETQFRQLVAIYEVLKDEERRRRYDDILENGLPDWRQPVFYYRRVRKMSNAELGFLLFLIFTIGHYGVIWSIYLQMKLDELLTKKEKKKKKKPSSRLAEEVRTQERPHWQDLLPLKLSVWIYLSIRNLPQTVQEVKQHYEDQLKQQQEAEQEPVIREKRPKVKKPKVEFPVYECSSDNQNYLKYDQTTSIEDIEEQMDDWLKDMRAERKKSVEWTEEELSFLSRLMVKFPGGTPGRWEKIAHELGRSVSHVTTKVKQVKDNVNHTPGLVKLSELKESFPSVRSLPVDDSVMTQRVGGVCEDDDEGEEEDQEDPVLRRRNRKCPDSSDVGDAKGRGRRQRDFDPTAVDEEEAGPQETRDKNHASTWTQNQQKLLELALQQFPRGTTERWDRIAKVVPGKTKEECMIRYKMLAELVQKRRQVKSPAPS